MQTTENTRRNTRQYALFAGIGLLLMTVAAGFSYGYVHSKLVVSNDPAATYINLKASLALFKAEIFGWGVILLADLAVAWCFYKVFEPTHKALSLVTGGVRVLYAAFLAVAVSKLYALAVFLSKPEAYVLLGDAKSADKVTQWLAAFDNIWSLGLVFFGIHLCLLGFLAFKAKSVPRLIIILLIIAGASYSTVHGLYTLAPVLTNVASRLESLLALPMAAGELAFGLWMMMKWDRSKAPIRKPKA